jgi:hypothetical protein
MFSLLLSSYYLFEPKMSLYSLIAADIMDIKLDFTFWAQFSFCFLPPPEDKGLSLGLKISRTTSSGFNSCGEIDAVP